MSTREEFLASDNFAEATMFPLSDLTARHLAGRGHLRGVNVAWNCHLTALTAVAARALAASGCHLFISECNPGTSDDEAIAYMRELGIEIFRGENACREILSRRPDVISDTGLDLISQWFHDRDSSDSLKGGCEITTSGITRLKELRGLNVPIININDGRIKSQIENFHGVGDGLLKAVLKLQDGSGNNAGGGIRTACVIGYGRVGAGVADYLSRSGIEVIVVDADPVRQLQAHFDRFSLASTEEALQHSDLIVTATGSRNLITAEKFRLMQDGALVVNVGHWREELDLEGLKEISSSVRAISNELDEYEIPGSSNSGSQVKRIKVATKGDPANVAMLTGSVEPTMLHLSTEMLCIEYVAMNHSCLPPGEVPVPAQVENQVARMALQAFGFESK